MSYPLFLLIALSITILLAIAIAGPLSALCVLGFWVVHHIFVQWRFDSAPLHSMSDWQLDALHSDWTRGIFWHSVTHISAVRRRCNASEIKKALKRVIAILELKIQRAEKSGLEIRAINEIRRELESFKNELKNYSPDPKINDDSKKVPGVTRNELRTATEIAPKTNPVTPTTPSGTAEKISETAKERFTPSASRPPTNRRMCLDEFEKYIGGLGKGTAVQSTIRELAASPKKLTLQSPSVRFSMAGYIEQFKESLTEEQQEKYKATLNKLLDACDPEEAAYRRS